MDDQTKLTMQSQDLSDLKFAQLQALFPQVFTEAMDENGNTIRAINTELLEQEINTKVLDGKKERYEFTWPDKRQAIRMANTPTNAALRPCRKESVDFDTTENLYIEGDNLEVLKLLRETYFNKVKMVYIDPPYNTGNDFIYEDDFSEPVESFRQRDGQFDEQGNRLVQNLQSNGRFHTDWLNMMYPRLKLVRDLLTNDGAIFISIDDSEVDNLKKICDEVFGAYNFIACIVWKRKRGRDNSAKWFSKAHEYVLLYAKNKNYFNTNFLPLDEDTKKAYKNPDNDPRGDWRMLACWARGTQGGVSYDFTTKDGQYFSERLWLFSKKNLTALDKDNKLVVRGNNIYRKLFLTENRGKIPETLWNNVSNAANAADEIKRLFNETIIFDTPKPVPYISEMLRVVSSPNDIILDFFSGSSTTAHAIMQLNAEDGGKRKFIMVQLPEETPNNSLARNAGFETISDIGKERIRRASRKIKEESPITTTDLDVGFRVLKLDSSNMKEVFYTPDEMMQTDMSFDGLVNNIKEDRSDEDLLLTFGLIEMKIS